MRLRRYLQDNGLTQQAFADLISVSQSSVARYCDLEVVPTASVMRRIFEVTKGQVAPGDFYEIADLVAAE